MDLSLKPKKRNAEEVLLKLGMSDESYVLLISTIEKNHEIDDTTVNAFDLIEERENLIDTYRTAIAFSMAGLTENQELMEIIEEIIKLNLEISFITLFRGEELLQEEDLQGETRITS